MKIIMRDFFGKAMFSIASYSPVVVGLVDVVEMTGCKEAKSKGDIKSESDVELRCFYEDKINYEQLCFNITVQSNIILTCSSRNGRCSGRVRL